MKQYRVINTFDGNQDQHEYNIEVIKENNAVTFEMYRTNNDVWGESRKGEKCISIVDTGDGFLLPKNIKGELDYDVAAELYILLSFINKKDKALPSLFEGTIETIEIIDSINL
jgi:hypothetical protein